MDASQLFAQQLVGMKYEQLPPEVVEAVKKQILDFIGVAMAGAMKDGAKQVRELAVEMGGAPQSTVFGLGVKVPAPNAAQANATAAHSLDFDDVHEAAIMHPGVVTIPTALAAGEYMGGMPGRELITAVALGGDMICRMGLATRPGENIHKYGWHFTTLNGYMTAAAVASRIMKLTVEEAVSAIGIGYHQSSGNGQAVKDGVHTKRLGPGFSTRGGIYAAMLAKKGVTGARNSMEGVQGIYNVYHMGHYSQDILIGDLGTRFESLNVSIKPYPCCRGVHPTIDAALALVGQGVGADNLEKIIIAVGEGPMGLLGAPIEVKAHPRNVVDSQFSLAWGCAVAIAKGRPGLKYYTDEALNDPEIQVVANKVEMELDTSLNGVGLEPVRITAVLKDGTKLTAYKELATGSPEQPMTFEDCEAKFRDCVANAEKTIPEKNVDKIVKTVKTIDTLDDISELIKLLVWA